MGKVIKDTMVIVILVGLSVGSGLTFLAPLVVVGAVIVWVKDGIKAGLSDDV